MNTSRNHIENAPQSNQAIPPLGRDSWLAQAQQRHSDLLRLPGETETAHLQRLIDMDLWDDDDQLYFVQVCDDFDAEADAQTWGRRLWRRLQLPAGDYQIVGVSVAESDGFGYTRIDVNPAPPRKMPRFEWMTFGEGVNPADLYLPTEGHGGRPYIEIRGDEGDLERWTTSQDKALRLLFGTYVIQRVSRRAERDLFLDKVHQIVRVELAEVV